MAEHKKWIQKKSDLWSIPNILGYFRLALIPVFAVFIFGQRFFVKGLVAGAVKG